MAMNKQEIGNRIKTIRNNRGISQEKLALDSNLDRTYINSVENGKRNITIESLTKITDALNVSLKDFFDVEYKMNHNPENTVFLICSDTINYQRTMIDGVKIDELKSLFSYDDYVAILKYANNGLLYIWGTSETNKKIFNLLEPGNIGLFSNNGKIFSTSKLLYKITNYDFSSKYWNNKKDKIWPCILIMDSPKPLNIPVSTLMTEANYKKKFIQGLIIPRGEHNFLIKQFLDKTLKSN